MNITKEKLEKLYKLTKENAELKSKASENLRTAKDRSGEETITLEREGKKVEIKEKTLWDEVFYLGADSDAGKALKERHPQVFELYELQGEKAAEMKKFVVKEFGFDFTAMTISDYIKITDAMVDYKLKQREENED